MFVTSRGHPYAEFERALKNGNVWVAEAVARELQHVWLEDALKLTHLYAEKEQWDKFERAALKWLRRYLDEKEPTLKNFAKVVWSLRTETDRGMRERPLFEGERSLTVGESENR